MASGKNMQMQNNRRGESDRNTLERTHKMETISYIKEVNAENNSNFFFFFVVYT
jgi:hypothetical protein